MAARAAQTRACWNTSKGLFLVAFPFKLVCDASQVPHPSIADMRIGLRSRSAYMSSVHKLRILSTACTEHIVQACPTAVRSVHSRTPRHSLPAV